MSHAFSFMCLENYFTFHFSTLLERYLTDQCWDLEICSKSPFDIQTTPKAVFWVWCLSKETRHFKKDEERKISFTDYRLEMWTCVWNVCEPVCKCSVKDIAYSVIWDSIIKNVSPINSKIMMASSIDQVFYFPWGIWVYL